MQCISEMIIKYRPALIPVNFNGNMTNVRIVVCQYSSVIKIIMFKIPSLFVATKLRFCIVYVAEKQSEWLMNES